MDQRFNRTAPSPLRQALSKLHSHVKGKKYISRGLNAFGFPKLGAAAQLLGYGRRDRVKRRRRLRGGVSKSAAEALAPLTQSRGRRLFNRGMSLVKKHRVISRALTHMGHDKFGRMAEMWGWGKRRPARRVARRLQEDAPQFADADKLVVTS